MLCNSEQIAKILGQTEDEFWYQELRRVLLAPE